MRDDEISQRVFAAAEALNAELRVAWEAGLEVDLGTHSAEVVEHHRNGQEPNSVTTVWPGVDVYLSRPIPKPSKLREEISRAYRARVKGRRAHASDYPTGTTALKWRK